MIKKLKYQAEGLEKFFSALSNPSFTVGAARHFIGTLLNSFNEELYDTERVIDPSKETAVIMPGWASEGNSYRKLAETFDGGLNLFSPDTFPRGLKAVLSRRGLVEQAILALDFINKLSGIYSMNGEKKKIHLIGHSNGGVAALLALHFSGSIFRNRENIGKIITMASPIKPSEECPYGYLPLAGDFFEAVKDIRPDSGIYAMISPYYEKISLSCVALKDGLFPPEIQYADPGKALLFETGHYGIHLEKKHCERAAEAILDVIRKK